MKNTGKDRNKEYVTVGEIEVAEYHSFVADLLYAKMKRGNA